MLKLDIPPSRCERRSIIGQGQVWLVLRDDDALDWGGLTSTSPRQRGLSKHSGPYSASIADSRFVCYLDEVHDSPF